MVAIERRRDDAGLRDAREICLILRDAGDRRRDGVLVRWLGRFVLAYARLMSWVLGLDIGGSTTRARLAADGNTVSEASGDSASWTAAGSEQASGVLQEVITSVRRGSARSLDAVCAGAAGSATPAARRWLHEALEELTGATRILVVDDSAVILPAAGHDVGLAVICGTGSVVYGCDQARAVRGGGWGYLLGDEAGGYWLVRSALQMLLERRDRGESLDQLGDALVAKGDLDAVLSRFYADPRPQVWAAHVREVLACGDLAVDAERAAARA